jgi:hypothetical protein
MSIQQLIADPATPIQEIGTYLDGLDGAARWDEVGALGRSAQRTLYEKAHAQAIGLDHFVNGSAPRTEVIHDGKNTLPLPPPLQRFQKRFCKPDGAGGRLYGYNEGVTRKVVGPGYFVAVPTRGRPSWEARGPVVIDYHEVPDGPVVDGWPKIHDNDWRLQRFVYHQTRDFMRKVSKHVSIGAAYKREKPLDHYFVLCRRDA